MKTVFRILLLVVIAASFQQATNQSALLSSAGKTNMLDSLIYQEMKKSGLVGIGAAIIVNNEVVWMNGYGYADQEKGKPFTPYTIMNTGSIAKTFTGVCIMHAVENKLLSLDEDINTYLPFKVINPYFPDEKITIRDIATHSSSLIDRSPFYSDSLYYDEIDSPEPLGEFLKNYFVKGGKHYSSENFYNAKPGAYWDYSNIAMALAGYILELKTGKKLNEYSKEVIQKPLKMKSTGWFFNEFDINKHTKLYQVSGDSTITIPLYGCTTYPDGGVRSSVADLTKFFICLLNNGKYKKVQILKKESVDQMQQFQFTATHKPENLDIIKKNEGLFWRTKFGGKMIGHGGSDPGIKTEMLTDLKKEVAVILFTNTDLSEDKQVNGYFNIFDLLYKHGQSIKNK
ncbi:MAG: serine hydrolase domain-containing protein [Bacteroidia bacterium]